MSSGRDGISNTLLKTIMPIISKPLTLIINQMLNTGISPDNLKIAKVVPLYKKEMMNFLQITGRFLCYLQSLRFLKE